MLVIVSMRNGGQAAVEECPGAGMVELVPARGRQRQLEERSKVQVAPSTQAQMVRDTSKGRQSIEVHGFSDGGERSHDRQARIRPVVFMVPALDLVGVVVLQVIRQGTDVVRAPRSHTQLFE